MSLSGKEIHAIIRERKEREKLVRQEAKVGEQLPPLLELARAKASLVHGFTEEELDAEIARSRERRKK